MYTGAMMINNAFLERFKLKGNIASICKRSRPAKSTTYNTRTQAAQNKATPSKTVSSARDPLRGRTNTQLRTISAMPPTLSAGISVRSSRAKKTREHYLSRKFQSTVSDCYLEPEEFDPECPPHNSQDV